MTPKEEVAQLEEELKTGFMIFAIGEHEWTIASVLIMADGDCYCVVLQEFQGVWRLTDKAATATHAFDAWEADTVAQALLSDLATEQGLALDGWELSLSLGDIRPSPITIGDFLQALIIIQHDLRTRERET